MAKNWEVNELVWAKMKGFPPWPGRVSSPEEPEQMPKKPKGDVHCIYFYGSNNYAWIDEKNITSYDGPDKEKNQKTNKETLKDAIKDIEKYIKRKAEGRLDEPEEEPTAFDQLLNDDLETPDTEVPEKKKAKKRPRESSGSSKRSKKSLENGGYPSAMDISMSTSLSSSQGSSSSRVSAARAILTSEALAEPQRPEILMVSDAAGKEDITPTKKKIGFLGLGNMGSGIVANLLQTGHDVTVWNRTQDRTDPFTKKGAKEEMTPMDIVEKCDIIMSCLSDPRAVRELVFGNCGVLVGFKKTADSGDTTKAYVEMTTIDPATSQDVAQAIRGLQGRYLEAPIIGSMQLASEGKLILCTSGDKSVFDDLQSVFDAISESAFYQGTEIGFSEKMAILLSMFSGVCKVALGEVITLAEKMHISAGNLVQVFGSTRYASPAIMDDCESVLRKSSDVRQSVALQQKDMRMGLELGDEAEVALNVAAAANESYKHAKQKGYKEHDVCLIMCHKRL